MLVIGISGGSGSGKSTFVKNLLSNLPAKDISILHQDSYYKDNGHIPLEERRKLNFDHPDALDFDLLIQHINQLKKGQSIEQPTYSFISCTRLPETITVSPGKVLIVEGLLLFIPSSLRDLYNLKVFIDAEADNRLARIIVRDKDERGRDHQEVIDRYFKTVKPMHDQFVEPSKQYADLIVTHGGNNTVAGRLIRSYIENRIQAG